MKRVWILTGAGVAVGALAGWLYWYYWGCTNGCSITGSPLNSSLYGAFMGGLLFNSFKQETGPGDPGAPMDGPPQGGTTGHG